MKALYTVAFAACLACAATSCSSDSKSAPTTAAASASTASTASTAAAGDPATTAADDDATTDAGSATTAAAAVTPPDVDISDLSPTQAKALATTLTTAATFGLEIDSACLAAVLAQMSDADAQLLVDAKVGEDPVLSPAGEALSDDATKCVLSTGTATLTTTES